MRHDTILLACGTQDSRTALSTIFEEKYNILEASTASQTFLLLEQNRNCIAAVLLDLTAIDRDSLKLLGQGVSNRRYNEVAFVVLLDDYAPVDEATAFELGAADVIVMPADPMVIHNRVNTLIELNRHKWHLEDLLDERTQMLRQSNETLVDALSSIIEYRSLESGQHILRIRHFTKILLSKVAESCPEYGLTPDLIDTISSASVLHDIGKIGIPDAVLNKPDSLTPEERLIMQEHSLIGCRILESLQSTINREYLHYAHNICHYHHERWDGSGYPEGLRGDDTPICAQVVGLADAYDALTTARVYKGTYTHEQALNMILNGECGAFSPKLLECFKRVAQQFAILSQTYADGHSPNADDITAPLPDLSRPADADSLHTLQLKYQTLLHYLGATVVEVDLDQDFYHLIYNPNPSVNVLNTSAHFGKDGEALACQVSSPEEKQLLQEEFRSNMQLFLDNDLRRHSYRCLPFLSSSSPVHQRYEVIFLRPDPSQRQFLLLWQKSALPGDTIPDVHHMVGESQSDYAIFDSFAASYCCRNDKHRSFRSFGPGFSTMLGYTHKELEEHMDNSLMSLIPEDEHQRLKTEAANQLASSHSVELEHHLRHKNGHLLQVINRLQLVIGADGQEYLYGILLDVTPIRLSQKDLRMTHEHHQIILDQTECVVFEWDMQKDTIHFSSHWKSIFGYEPLTHHLSTSLEQASHLHPADIPLLWNKMYALQMGAAYQVAEVRIARADGRYMWCRIRATSIRDADGKLLRTVGLITNIDEEKKTTQNLLKQAERDPLTKLLNKEAGRKRAEDYLSTIKHGFQTALLILDMDNFKMINDRYGHLFGDAVLTRIASQLQKLFRSDDIVARIGGDEFLVMMKGNPSIKLVRERCALLVQSFKDTLQELAPDCPASCSVGIAITQKNGTSYTDLFQQADKALYFAKRSKNTFVLYDERDPSFLSTTNLPSTAVTRIDSDEQPHLNDDSLIRYAFQRLYLTNNLEEAIGKLLDVVGKQMNVSRVYIFENNEDNTLCSNTFEWCNEGIEPQIDVLQGVSYKTDIPDYDKNFNEQGIFYVADVAQLPAHLYDILAPQGIKSMLHCGIYDSGVFRGYVGFDECNTVRLWTQEQIEVLKFCAEIVSIFLLKKRAQDASVRFASNLTSVLDNQNAWIYVVDPDDFTLHYLNAKTRALAPAAKPGMKCYECLHNRTSRCDNCPAANIRREQNAQQRMDNLYLNKQVIAEASLIQWGEKDACLLTCRDILTALN